MYSKKIWKNRGKKNKSNWTDTLNNMWDLLETLDILGAFKVN